MKKRSNRTPLLDRVNDPADMRDLSDEELKQLADELRYETIDAVSVTGGHLGAGLGVVELTVALHHVFDTPADRLIWDVGHQSYPHKILTGRRDRIRTIRQPGGLYGFTKRSESEYDPFGAAHSSTSISAGLGMAVARDLAHGANDVIAVIGDGAMSAGMAYEAMNNAGSMDTRLIVILNDNDMSIAPPVGAMSAHLSRIISSKPYRSIRHLAREMAKKFPRSIETAARRAEEYARGMVTGGTLFGELTTSVATHDLTLDSVQLAAAHPPTAGPTEWRNPGAVSQSLCRPSPGGRARPRRYVGPRAAAGHRNPRDRSISRGCRASRPSHLPGVPR